MNQVEEDVQFAALENLSEPRGAAILHSALSLAVLFAGVFVARPAAAAVAPEKPNLVFLLADDLGWADVEFQGPKTRGLHETPNIDRLAAQGMNFERFYPGASNCSPSRACLMTGMYTPRHHIYMAGGWTDRRVDVTKMRWKVPKFEADESFNTFFANINQLASDSVSIAEVLRPAGYVTARIGKWHLGDDLQGFDVVSSDGTPGNHSNRSYYNDDDVTERMTETSIAFMRQNRDRPFLLYLAHWEPHGPLSAHADRIAYYEKKFAAKGDTDRNPIFAAMVEQVDLSTGRIMAALDELGLSENTVVIFSSDNGGWYELPRIPNNFPLKASKGSYYEGGIRTPFIVRWPAVIKPGSRTDYPVTGVDLMPTLADIAGARMPESQPVDGVSILPLLEGRMLSERSIFFHFPLYLGGSPLPMYRGGPKSQWRAVPSTTIMRGDWKLVYYYEYDRYELFNLRDDISEARDLSVARPEVGDRLLAELQAWTRRVAAPIPQVPNDKFNPRTQSKP